MQADDNLSDLRARAQKLREELPNTDIDVLVSSYPVEVLNVSSFMVRCPALEYIPMAQALNHRAITFKVVPSDPFCNSALWRCLQDAINEARRLVPSLDITYTLANNPTQIFSFQKGDALIPYDDPRGEIN